MRLQSAYILAERFSHRQAALLVAWLILCVPVVIDLINGYLIQILQSDFSAGILYRGFFLLALFPAIFFRQNRPIAIALIVIIQLWLLNNIFWVVNAKTYSFSFELKQFTKYLFPYILLSFLVLVHYKYSFGVTLFMKLVVLFGLIGSAAIIFSFFTEVGVSTYTYSYGTTSFFKAQNDIGLTFLISFTFANYFLHKRFSKKRLLSVIVIFLGLIFLGTRTSLIGAFLIIFGFVFFGFISKKDFWIKKPVRAVLLMALLISILTSAVVYTINLVSEYNYLIEKFENLTVEMPRDRLVTAAKARVEERSTMENLFGEGAISYRKHVGRKLSFFLDIGRPVEQDYYSLIGPYGHILGYMIFFIPVFLLVKMLFVFIMEANLINFAILFSLMLFVGHAILAGHAMESPTVSSAIAVCYFHAFVNEISFKKLNENTLYQ